MCRAHFDHPLLCLPLLGSMKSAIGEIWLALMFRFPTFHQPEKLRDFEIIHNTISPKGLYDQRQETKHVFVPHWSISWDLRSKGSCKKYLIPKWKFLEKWKNHVILKHTKPSKYSVFEVFSTNTEITHKYVRT